MQEIPLGGNAVAPKEPELEGYTFDKWDKSFSNVQGDLVVKAIYIVTFLDYDGTVLATEEVNYKESATAPIDPVREGYDFTGWSHSFDEVTSNLVITAKYKIKEFTVSFVDSNYELIGEVQTVKFGGSATAPTAPELVGHKFSKWDNSFINVTSNLTIKALYDINKYEVIFLDYDGTLIEKQVVDYMTSAVAPSNPTRVGYNFITWNSSFENITSDLIVIAQYKIRQFTVVFVDSTDTPIGNPQTINYGGTAVAPDAPKLEGKTFKKWDKSFTNVINNLTVKAIYEVTTYVVTFLKYDGTVYARQVIEHNKNAVTPSVRNRPGYDFIGWTGSYENVTSDLIIIPIYKVKEFTVTFVDSTDSPIGKVQHVKYGESAIAPQAPKVECKTFKMWDKKFDVVTYDITVKAIYDIATYVVKFLKYDGSLYATQTIKHNGTAITPSVPFRDGYDFVGWNGSYENVTSDLILLPIYKEQEFKVTFVDSKDAPIGNPQTVKYGQSAIAPNAPILEGHQFSKWNVPFNSIKGDLTVKAVYTINVYEVTFLDYDGKHLITREVKYLENATAPNNPVREGYTFIGWSTSLTEVKKNIIVIARYSQKTVELEIKEYESSKVSNVDFDSKFKIADLLTKGNYIFEGYYSDASKTKLISNDINYEFTANQTARMIIYVKYNFSFKSSKRIKLNI